MNKNISILLVDDDLDDKFLFEKALATIDDTIACYYCPGGEEGLRWLLETTKFPDCIFLDVNMPRMNGMEFLAQLKKQPQVLNIPVVMYSTAKNEFHMTAAKELGADLYVRKPYSLQEAQRSIVYVLETIKGAASKAN